MKQLAFTLIILILFGCRHNEKQVAISGIITPPPPPDFEISGFKFTDTLKTPVPASDEVYPVLHCLFAQVDNRLKEKIVYCDVAKMETVSDGWLDYLANKNLISLGDSWTLRIKNERIYKFDLTGFTRRKSISLKQFTSLTKKYQDCREVQGRYSKCFEKIFAAESLCIISYPIFNSGKNVALVTFHWLIFGNDRSGAFAILRKTNKGWIIVKQQGLYNT